MFSFEKFKIGYVSALMAELFSSNNNTSSVNISAISRVIQNKKLFQNIKIRLVKYRGVQTCLLKCEQYDNTITLEIEWNRSW